MSVLFRIFWVCIFLTPLMAGADTDQDGMPDAWETQHQLDPQNPDDAVEDPDGDAFTNLEEFQNGTDPRTADQSNQPSAEMTSLDTIAPPPPLDSDGDGIPDAFENLIGLDPFDPTDASGDLDGDDLSNLEEWLNGTDPTRNQSFRLNENCTAYVLNRVAQVNPDGTFEIRNIPIPDGPFRVRVICEHPAGTDTGNSEFVIAVENGVTPFSGIEFIENSPAPSSLQILSPIDTLTPEATLVQLLVVASYPNGVISGATSSDTGVTYVSSNASIASVDPEGLVTAHASGNVLIIATLEGASTSILLRVELSQDQDNDGLPDDFEEGNAVNPGGSNLSLLPGVAANASTFSQQRNPELVIDGNPNTSWFTDFGDAANRRSAPFIEVILPEIRGLSQVQLLGNRRNPVGFDFFAGIFQAFDDAGDEVFNSGEVELPGPTRDIAVPIDLSGIKRVRFTATRDESVTPGLSEMRLLTQAGGPGLNLNDPADAAMDFDFDGLTNLEEFEMGSNIFNADSDGDFLSDLEEAGLGSNPILADSDGDGLADGAEIDPTGDADNDGIPNILDPDSDNDGLSDGVEDALGLNLFLADSDGDNTPDSGEDSDGDGLTNVEELFENTNPAIADTDADGLRDGEEVLAGADGFITNPLNPDSDGDGMQDGYESLHGLDPTDPSDAALDPDNDGLTNLEESQIGSDPFNPDIVAPAVSFTTPAEGDTEFPVTDSLTVRLSEPVSDMLPPNAISLFYELTLPDARASEWVRILGDTALSKDALTLIFTPFDPLPPLTLHQLRINQIRDLAGNPLADETHVNFESGEFIDTVQPHVAHFSPSGSDIVAPVNAIITAHFSEPIDPSGIDQDTFRVYNLLQGTVVAGAIQVEPGNQTVSIVPDQPLPVNTAFSVTFSATISDLAGNTLSGGRFFSFTTGFERDAQRPRLERISPNNAWTDIPINALIQLQFDEPVVPNSVLAHVRIEQDGQPIPGSFAFTDGNQRLTFTSANAFPPNSFIDVITSSEITDLTGNPLDNPTSIRFRTSDTADLERPQILTVTPGAQTPDIPTTTPITLVFDQAIDPITLNANTFGLYLDFLGERQQARISVAPNRRSATLRPIRPLIAGLTYSIHVNNQITDLAGNHLRYSFWSTFKPLPLNDDQPPIITSISPPDGSDQAPLNAIVSIAWDEPVDNPYAFTLSSDGVPLSGQSQLSYKNRVVTFTPDQPLMANTRYTIAVNPVSDLFGNGASAQSFSFTTGSESETASFWVVDNEPAHGATDIAVDAPVIITYSKLVNPASVHQESIFIQDDASGTNIEGTFETQGNVVTFTPAPETSRLAPANRTIEVVFNGQVTDLAGINSRFGSFSYTTAGDPDTQRPSLLSSLPQDGAVDVTPGQSVRIAFSEPIDGRTLISDNIGIFSDGEVLPISIRHQPDGRAVTLESSFPANRQITIALTDHITDLEGNPLHPATIRFRSSEQAHERPTVQLARPYLYAINVPVNIQPILAFSRPIDPDTLEGHVHFVYQGSLIPGEHHLSGDGRYLTFTPSQSLPYNAEIRVVVETDVRDIYGSSILNPYLVFYTETDLSLDTAALVGRYGFYFQNTPLNTQLDLGYNKALDPTTVTQNNVRILQNNVDIPVSVQLAERNRVIRIKPQNPLQPNTSYVLQIEYQSVRDVDGFYIRADSFSFNTESASETETPQLGLTMPADGQADVPINTMIRLNFDGEINPLSAHPDSISLIENGVPVDSIAIFHSDDLLSLVIHPNRGLKANSTYRLEVNNLLSINGLTIPDATLDFHSGSHIDVDPPQILTQSPANGELDVPTNASILVGFNEPIDISATKETLQLNDQDVGVLVANSCYQSGDLASLLIDPERLGVGRTYRLNLAPVDMAGNRARSTTLRFDTGFESDLQPPALTHITPAQDSVGAMLNTAVHLTFDEPISLDLVSRIDILHQSVPIPISRERFGFDGITLNPIELLQPNQTYQVLIEGLTDTSGNVMPNPINFQFSTGDQFDLERPYLIQSFPSNSANGVSLNADIRIMFNEPLNPNSIRPGNITLINGFHNVPFDLQIDPDFLAFTLIPLQDMQPATWHVVYLNNLTDIALNPFIGQSQMSFLTGQTPDSAPPQILAFSPRDQQTDTPVNPSIRFDFNEEIMPLSSSAFSLSHSGNAIPGIIRWLPQQLIFTPQPDLQSNESYTIHLQNISDLAGNPLPDHTSTFSTGSNNQPDTTRPQILSNSPTNGSSGHSPLTQVVITMNEPIDPTSVTSENVSIVVEGPGSQVPGDLALNGNVITFTPTPDATREPPANAVIRVVVTGVRDLAGNASSYDQFRYTIGNFQDNTPPRLLASNPENGDEDVHPSVQPTLIFSESIPWARARDHILLFVNGDHKRLTFGLSSDGRTVTIANSLPANANISIRISDGLTDMSDNPFQAQTISFTTGSALQTGVRLLSLKPSNGNLVSSDAQFAFFFDLPVDPTSLATGFRTSNNGELLDGQTQVSGDGRTLHFTPDQPLPPGSLIQIFLTEDLQFMGGGPYSRSKFYYYTANALVPGTFRIKDVNTSQPLPINAPIDLLLEEAIDPDTFQPEDIQVTLNGSPQSIHVQLLDGNKRIRVNSTQGFPASQFLSYTISYDAFKDLQGDPFSGLFTNIQTTDAADNQPPILINQSPQNNQNQAAITTNLRLRFNEPINHISLSQGFSLRAGSIDVPVSINYLQQSMEVHLSPKAVLQSNASHELVLHGIEDLGGNLLPQTTVTFHTNGSADFSAPVVVSRYPSPTGIAPTNASFYFQADQPLNPIDVHDFYKVRRVGENQPVLGDLIPVIEDHAWRFTPHNTLEPGADYAVDIPFNIRDLSGNWLNSQSSYTITTSAQQDMDQPNLEITNPPAGAVVPTNTRFSIRFDEQIQSDGFTDLSLKGPGGHAPLDLSISGDQHTLVFKPNDLLLAETTYTFSVTSFTDLAGNTNVTPISISWTTGSLPDLIAPAPDETQPANGASEVELDTDIRWIFPEPLDALNPPTLSLRDISNGVDLSYQLSFSPDRKTLIITPDAPLPAGVAIQTWINNPTDDAGNKGTSRVITFTTQAP